MNSVFFISTFCRHTERAIHAPRHSDGAVQKKWRSSDPPTSPEEDPPDVKGGPHRSMPQGMPLNQFHFKTIMMLCYTRGELAEVYLKVCH